MSILQIQPSRHSCLVTAFAMILKMKVQDLMKAIGHDGSEIIDPSEAEPACRRAFHIQELIDVAYKLNYSVIGVEAQPSLQLCKSIYTIWEPDKSMVRISQYLLDNEGVLVGDHHAVAWIKGFVHDPCGKIYSIDKFAFHTFYMVNKKERISVFR